MPIDDAPASSPEPLTILDRMADFASPRWANEAMTAIDLDVTLDGEPIVFTATAADATAHGPALFARAAGGEFGTVAAYAAPAAPVPASITRRQCAKALKGRALISGAEAIAMTRNGTPPAMVQALIDAMPPEAAEDAELDFAADTYERANPLLNALMEATGATQGEIDDFFREAVTL